MGLFDIKRFRIPTPEQTYLEFAYAGIGRRLLAVLIDMALIGASWVFIGFLATLLATLATYALGQDSAGAYSFALTASIVAIGLMVVSPFLFHYLYEFYWGGQTPGKRLLAIRVLRTSGLRLDALSCILRNLVRYVDFLPYYYLLGAWSVVVTPNQQRLGDLVAGTVVVWMGPKLTSEKTADVTNELIRSAHSRPAARTSREDRIRGLLADYFIRRARLSNPARKLILRRLAKLTGCDPSTAQAELEQTLYAYYQGRK